MSISEAGRSEVIRFLDTVAKPGRRVDLPGDANLVDAGVLDSLAIVQIIAWLESDHGLDLAARPVDPVSLMTVDGIIKAIENRPGD